MNERRHYTGLTDTEVLASRQKHGVNILTPPEKETLWNRLRKTCAHWISISMATLVIIAVVAAASLTASMGQMIWVMPAILLLATFLIILVGFFGGFNDPLFRILIMAFVLSIGISIYEFEWAGAGGSTFFEPIGIIVALLLATGVAFFLERSNEKTFQSLNKVNDDTPVKVIRNNNVCQVPRRDIVVGDIVIVETGEEVPADCELLESLNLLVNESSLTGEPQATKTTVEKDFDPDATYPSNHIMKGTTVNEGYCTARVLAVGDRTESGKVFEAAQVEEGDPTPLSRKLNTLAGWITTASYVIAALVVVGRIVSYFLFNNPAPFDWLAFISYVLQTFMIAVTLIVVAVPEGLPMSVTLSLAFSMRKLMKQNTLPRTMHSCETMGAATVICTDKTGTLTQNQMQVAETVIVPHAAPSAQPFAIPAPVRGGAGGGVLSSPLLAEMIAVNTTANLDLSDPTHPKAIGNPTEGALLLWLHAQGIDYQEIRERTTIIDRLPFTTENKYMATLVQSDTLGSAVVPPARFGSAVVPPAPKGQTQEGICNPRQSRVLYVKGAPEILMAFSSIDEEERKALEEALLSYQRKAMRTLALAYLELDDATLPSPLRGGVGDGVSAAALPSLSREALGEGTPLRFVGIFAISDPVRREVPAAISECIDAGIQVKIVTGDTPGTAKEIGRQIGLWTDADTDSSIMTGVEFADMADEELKERILGMKILARARPNDKERLVRMLKAQGQVVAVTGDGTNDAPALNAADVGLSMGDGTAVAKEASDMTIQDNSFSTIANAVMWGRSLYKNIQRFVMFQLTINVVACLIVLIGAFLGTESPLTVTQMLWVNLIMDTFAAIALASLPPTRKVMLDKPRRDTDPIITRTMTWNIVGVGGFFTLLLFAILLYMERYDLSGTLPPSLTGEGLLGSTVVTPALSPYELSLFFTIFVMLQFWNMFNAKAFMTGRSAFARLAECRGFLFIAFVIFVGQILIVELGGQMFNVTHLHPVHWLIIIASTSLVLWVGEALRAIGGKRSK